MKTPTIGLNGTGVLALAGVAVAGLIVWRMYRTGQAVGAAIADTAGAAVDAVGKGLHAINPTNNDNVAARAVNNIGAAVSGNSDFSLGSWLYDLVNPDAGLIATGATGLTPSQTRYAKPPDTSNGSHEADTSGSVSFFDQGKSFKDLSDPYSVNPFRNIETFKP